MADCCGVVATGVCTVYAYEWEESYRQSSLQNVLSLRFQKGKLQRTDDGAHVVLRRSIVLNYLTRIPHSVD